MKFLKSIGGKIAIWHSIMFMFTLFLFSAFLFIIFTDMLTNEVDSMLAREGGMIAYFIEQGYPSSEIENYMNGLPVLAGVKKRRNILANRKRPGQSHRSLTKSVRSTHQRLRNFEGD